MADSADFAPSGRTLRVLMDTNIVLDVVLAREPWASKAKPIFAARDAGRVSVFLLASVLTDIFYVCRKQVGTDRARVVVGECLRHFSILPVDSSLLEAALLMPGPDFEDNIQIACAQAAGLDLIVTRDSSDFAHSSVPVAEPPVLAGRLSAP